MRKLILVSALLLTAASAQAGDSRSLSVGGIPTAPVTIEAPKPIAQVSIRLAQAATVASDATPVQVAPPAPPAPPQVQAAAPVQTQPTAPAPTTSTAATTTTTETKSASTTESKPKAVKKVRRESDEAKARRIAARYGVYW